jgi:hypothetical protein
VTSMVPGDHAPSVFTMSYNWPGWEHKRQHLMAVNLPIESADRDKPAFLTAGSILRTAQQQCASGRH